MGCMKRQADISQMGTDIHKRQMEGQMHTEMGEPKETYTYTGVKR